MVRASARPHPDGWNDDETMTLAEAAAAFFFPDGPLTLSSLRTAKRDGQLATVTIAGKVLTTAGAMRAMLRPAPTLPDRSMGQEDTSDKVTDGKVAQEWLRQRLSRIRREGR